MIRIAIIFVFMLCLSSRTTADDNKELPSPIGPMLVSPVERQLKPSKNPKLTPRAQSWLDSHNSRRKSYHTKFKTKYVPLQWSDSLSRDASKWANKLLKDCINRGTLLQHDPNNDYGENLASGYGKELPDTDNVLTRWVEREEKDPYPANAHYTQVLWRSTEYVGCADATASVKRDSIGGAERLLKRGGGKNRPNKKPNKKPNKRPGKKPNKKPGNKAKATKTNKNAKKGDGKGQNSGKDQNTKSDKDNIGGSLQCQIQVCRYARPGNCNISKYNSYKIPMLMDESPCPPLCPPGGK
jgi:hypothetical protein